jgi:hypothetical protein
MDKSVNTHVSAAADLADTTAQQENKSDADVTIDCIDDVYYNVADDCDLDWIDEETVDSMDSIHF